MKTRQPTAPDKSSLERSMIDHRFQIPALYGLMLLSLLVGLVYLYQTGGYVDGNDVSAQDESLRDYGVWINAGQNLSNGKDPYIEDPILKSGIFSSHLMYLLYAATGTNFLFFMGMQALNLIGLVFFLWQNRISSLGLTFLAFMMLTLSSTREILVNGQTTGVILGLFALLQRFLPKRGVSSNLLRTQFWSYALVLICGVSMFIILDLKPNLTIVPITVLIVHAKNFVVPISGFVIWLFHQIFYSIQTGTNLIGSWKRNLTTVTDYETNENLFGSLGFWQLLNSLPLPPWFMEVLPSMTFLFIGLLAVCFVLKRNFELAIFFGFLSNFFYSYFHFYSYFAILAFIAFWILKSGGGFHLGMFISSMQFSFNSNLLVTSSLSLLMLSFVHIFFRFNSIQNAINFSVGWISFVLLKVILSVQIGLGTLQVRSVITMIPVLLFLSMLISSERMRVTLGQTNTKS